MEGYYDYGPRVQLPRPLALIGFMGAGTHLTGHALASKLGLPLLPIDRHVEHEAGMSLSSLQVQRGDGARRALEHESIARAARERPSGIVVLGDGALLQRATLNLVCAQMDLIYIERPLDALYDAVRQELADSPGRYPEFVLKPPTREDLQTLLAEREPGYQQAKHGLHAERLHPQRVCDALVEELDLLA